MQTALALLENMRPRQWAKNGFIFAGILFDGQLLMWASMSRVLLGFVLLSLTASTIYLINDLVDIEKDRLHPKKRNRPLPSGRLPKPIGIGAAAVFPIIALGVGYVLSPAFAGVLILYLTLHIVYSFYLKNVVLLDIFAIAAGFVLRVMAGVVVIDVSQFSPWLYACAGLLSLFLAIGKRRQEMLELGDDAANIRGVFNDYSLPLLDDLIRMIVACTAIAYTLYATEAETIVMNPQLMLLTVPFIYYALFRYLFVIHRKGLGGDPTEVLYVDRPLQISITLWILTVIVLLYFA